MTTSSRAVPQPCAASARPPAKAGTPQGYLFLPASLRRARVLLWLRRTHAWCGFWGAALALLFGATGILLNHRAVMKIPALHTEQTTVQVALPGASPRDAHALAEQLRHALRLDKPAVLVKEEASQEIQWGGAIVRQPALYRVWFATPKRSYVAEYWAGNTYATVKQQDPNVWAFLTRLHMGTGAGVAWVLLVDTLAGGLLALALTGMLLWSRLHGPRLLAIGLAGGSALLALAVVWQAG